MIQYEDVGYVLEKMPRMSGEVHPEKYNVLAVLLPFGDRVVSDGHLQADAFSTTQESDREIEQARSRYGLIDRLPVSRRTYQISDSLDSFGPFDAFYNSYYTELDNGQSGEMEKTGSPPASGQIPPPSL